MIKGLAITPPTIGRISIGKVVEKNGKKMPEKDDQFTLTSQVQSRDGGWIAHPLDEELRKAQNGKIRSIPVNLLFDDPQLNFRASYTAFDRKSGRPFCVGDGESCKRVLGDTVKSMACPTPAHCSVGAGGQCKPYGRLNVLIGDEKIHGRASFVFRTTGYNSIRTLTARLLYFQAISGNKLSCLPLELRLRGKSTTQSFGTAIYFVDLCTRVGKSMEDALQEAQECLHQRQACGFNQMALDAAAHAGLRNGMFEDTEEEAPEVAQEFYSQVQVESDATTDGAGQQGDAVHGATEQPENGAPESVLAEKLQRQMQQVRRVQPSRLPRQSEAAVSTHAAQMPALLQRPGQPMAASKQGQRALPIAAGD